MSIYAATATALSFLLAMIGLWAFLGRLLGRSGWSWLQADYTAAQAPDGPRIRGVSIRSRCHNGSSFYQFGIAIVVAEEGLCLAPSRWLFGHKIVLVPWSAIHSETGGTYPPDRLHVETSRGRVDLELYGRKGAEVAMGIKHRAGRWAATTAPSAVG